MDTSSFNFEMVLSPYPPDLDPIEQVWRIARKKKTHNRFFGCLESLRNAVEGFFDDLSKPNEMLRCLCTFSWIDGTGRMAQAEFTSFAYYR